MNRSGCSSNRRASKAWKLYARLRCLPGRLGGGPRTARLSITRHQSWSNRLAISLELGGNRRPNGWNCWPRSMGGSRAETEAGTGCDQEPSCVVWRGCAGSAWGLSFLAMPCQAWLPILETNSSAAYGGASKWREEFSCGGWLAVKQRRARDRFCCYRLAPAPMSPARKWVLGRSQGASGE